MRRFVLGAAAFFVSTSFAFACGTERWAVKVGKDNDAGKVSMAAKTTSIDDLRKLRPPKNPNSRKFTRFKGEFKTYRIEGILTVIKGEKDEDYHLVIASRDNKKRTMIVESPSPGCAGGSKFLDQIKEVRQTIDSKFGKVKRKKKPNTNVTVTGVAFFDPLHGQEGVAPNGIELHPILNIVFH